MRSRSILGTLMITTLLAPSVMAQEKNLEDRVKRLEQTLQELKEEERKEREGVPPGATRPEIHREEAVGEPGVGPLPEVGRERRRDVQAPLGFGSTGSGRLVYAKPFVAAPKAIVGGYMDLFFESRRKASIDRGGDFNTLAGGSGISSNFDVQRFVPFIYADITEHVKFASEIEIEHGIREGTETEVSLEFAHIDYLIHEPLNVRAGIILLPIGKFNLLHDSPLNDLPDRPLVSQFIIPTTLPETGAGFYGTIYPTRLSKVDYELYVTTGPCGYDGAGTPRINEINGTRNSRQRKCATDDGFDINNGKAVVGRIAFSPLLGVEVAGSGYHGSYDPFSKRPMSIFAVDWTLQRGPFELIGESAWVYVQDNSRALTNNLAGDAPGSLLTGIGGNSGLGIPPQRMNGYYIQGNYHFMPEWLTRLAPKRFGEGSTFTSVVRWDQVNTNRDQPGGFGDLQRLTFGLNYRPIEDTVFKFAYFLDMKATNRATDERIHNSGIMLMAATYF